MWWQLLLLIIGLLLLIKGAGWLVDGASALAKRYHVSDLAIGLTVVAFGTSAPELVVNSIASFQNHQDIVFGNVIGSNNFNLFIILGIAGLITPLTVQSSSVWKEIPLSFIAIIILFVLTNDYLYPESHVLSRFDGILLLFLFSGFLYYVYKRLKTDEAEPEAIIKAYSTFKIFTFISIGLLGLVFGGRLVVTNAVAMATSLGMSEKVIGLTIIAAGTSLPELATSVVAALKKNNDIAVGNIIGSNIFNIFFILGVSSVINPIPYDTVFNIDLFILAGGTVFLFVAMFTGQRKKLDRWEALLLLGGYLVYLTYYITSQI
ncbi:MAG: calcium/sodium antiporter [Croceitalea sp.]|nr:calcium/sodium antiporter [Croceitalea sp.]MBT8239189.1 calcium/sodium antiporter [Croceitalea sp.]NNC33705.1 calcium/sodium antiporter [Croceitalea sp.]NNL09637.1 calcium/sodium antiporter [Croceitalea sp.]NNM18609.1 calcium/sodium antiporter [Croceitalea sp.]